MGIRPTKPETKPRLIEAGSGKRVCPWCKKGILVPTNAFGCGATLYHSDTPLGAFYRWHGRIGGGAHCTHMAICDNCNFAIRQIGKQPSLTRKPSAKSFT